MLDNILIVKHNTIRMNKLSTARSAKILNLLVEGMSMRAITRVENVGINTIARLVAAAGEACAAYHDEHVCGIRGRRRIECDEVWAFVYAKKRNVPHAKAAPDGAGDAWTFSAIDAAIKTGHSATWLATVTASLQSRSWTICGAASRTGLRLSTDGLKAYRGSHRGRIRRRRGFRPGYQGVRQDCPEKTTVRTATARPTCTSIEKRTA